MPTITTCAVVLTPVKNDVQQVLAFKMLAYVRLKRHVFKFWTGIPAHLLCGLGAKILKNRSAAPPRKKNSIATMHQVYIYGAWKTVSLSYLWSIFHNRSVKYVTIGNSINCNKALCKSFFHIYLYKHHITRKSC